MRSLGDLASGAFFFAALASEFVGHAKELEAAAVELEKGAKSLPGTYQDGWPALADYTISRKATGDSPLLETGDMRDAIQHSSDAHEANVGSNDPKFKYSEFGTVHEPARPVFGLAVIKAEPAIVAAVGKVTMERLAKE
jgi:phage gpG-like protein